ncbi:response regulator [bacterium]|nr:response regulator [bacterium]
MTPKFFGQYLLEKGYVTEEQLLNALEYQNSRIMRIGEIAINKGFMTPEEVEQVNLEQRRTDKFFGELAVNMGFLTDEQLEKVINIQKHNHIYLGEALVKLGFLSKGQLKHYLDEFHREQKPIEALKDIIPERLEIGEEVMSILDTAIKIFRRMANLYLKLGKGFFKSTQIENLHLISSVHFTGTLDFNFFLNLPPNVAYTITKNLYGNDNIEYDDEIVADCVGELANVVSGNACSQILEIGQKVYISPPESIFRRDNKLVEIENDRQVLVFPATVPIGYLEVGIMWFPPSDERKNKGILATEKKVLIVDDSILCRKQLKDIVNSIPDVRVVGSAKDGPEAIEMFRNLNPDIVIVDLVMPDMPGEELIRRIMELNEAAKIIIMSGVGGSADTILQELKAGVSAIISKPIDENETKSAIVKVITQNER